MTPEDLRLSAEMCGVFTGARRHHPIIWEPHKNPDQWQECILRMFELGDVWLESKGHAWFSTSDSEDRPTPINMKCSPLEFPVLALAELKRRMK